jgi:2-keto-4-pentenoate hydratase/2-oxohepta-3-ene-1,7-dioic acid hydratase in catechol pathway
VRLCRALVRATERVHLARLEPDRAVLLATESAHVAADVLREAMFDGTDLAGPGETTVALEDLTYLSPTRNPGRILCAALNYRAHAAETGREPPSEPMFFPKFSGSLVDPHRQIEVAGNLLSNLDYEGELAAIIGSRCVSVPQESAADHVFGYTIANDVSARAQQRADGQWWRAKGSDGLCPLGPIIVTSDELGDGSSLSVQTRVNGQLRQSGNTSDLIFSIPALVSFVSRFITLEPGDVLLTGTPPGVGAAMTPPTFLTDGDEIEIQIERIGSLTNTVSLEQR